VDMAGGGAVVATVDFAYKDDQRSSPQDSTSFTIPAYQVMTARLSYRFPNDRWQAALYCTNCLNEAYVSGGATWAGATDNGCDGQYLAAVQLQALHRLRVQRTEQPVPEHGASGDHVRECGSAEVLGGELSVRFRVVGSTVTPILATPSASPVF